MKTIIVGGVAGGASAAARLRRLDEKAEIVMLEKGEYISFANCGLPYFVGQVITDREDLTLQTPKSFHARFRVDVRIRSEVTAIDRDAKTVTVKNHETGETYTEHYDKLILSPGAKPVVPPIEITAQDRVFTLRTIPDTDRIVAFIEQKQPKSAVVVGAGYIGMEMAENLHARGIAVTIVELADHVVGPMDYDMACELHGHIRSKGVDLLLKNGVQKITDNGDTLTVTVTGGEIKTDMVIMAVGVAPDSALAKNAGLACNRRGAIQVDAHMRTDDADIYAVGDAVEITDFTTGEPAVIPLAGPANKQGRIAADNICGIASVYTGTQGTAIVKCFDYIAATTGMNERTAKRLGLDYEKSITFSAAHASYYPGGSPVTIKLLFLRASGKLLGAQITGKQGVDKRCDVLATAIRAGMTVEDLTKLELAYAPPFSSAKDPVNMAGFTAQNIIKGLTDVFHCDQLEEICKEDAVFLDVRTVKEYERGTIPGFINIPVDELRNRLGELDASKKIYVTCQIGLRGYIACRILSQNGFSCSNLSGGYRLYKTILDETQFGDMYPCGMSK